MGTCLDVLSTTVSTQVDNKDGACNCVWPATADDHATMLWPQEVRHWDASSVREQSLPVGDPLA